MVTGTCEGSRLAPFGMVGAAVLLAASFSMISPTHALAQPDRSEAQPAAETRTYSQPVPTVGPEPVPTVGSHVVTNTMDDACPVLIEDGPDLCSLWEPSPFGVYWDEMIVAPRQTHFDDCDAFLDAYSDDRPPIYGHFTSVAGRYEQTVEVTPLGAGEFSVVISTAPADGHVSTAFDWREIEWPGKSPYQVWAAAQNVEIVRDHEATHGHVTGNIAALPRFNHEAILTVTTEQDARHVVRDLAARMYVQAEEAAERYQVRLDQLINDDLRYRRWWLHDFCDAPELVVRAAEYSRSLGGPVGVPATIDFVVSLFNGIPPSPYPVQYPLLWKSVSGVPPGMLFHADDVTPSLTGTPTQIGTFALELDVRDRQFASNSNMGEHPARIVIEIEPLDLDIEATATLEGVTDQPGSWSFRVYDAPGRDESIGRPVTWNLKHSFPFDADLQRTTELEATLHATPTEAGVYSFTIDAIDDFGSEASVDFELTVDRPDSRVDATDSQGQSDQDETD